jgi:ABC-type transport system substrate-binding protein
VAFNLRHPVLKKTEVRRGLNYAVNRQEFIARTLRGEGQPAVSNIWPRHWAFDSDLTPYPYDPVIASQAFDSAGFRTPAVRMASAALAPPSRFRFTCLIFAGYANFERAALVVQKQLYDVGVQMDIEPLPMRDVMSRLSTGNFDAFLVDLVAGRDLSWPYRIWHSPGRTRPDLNSGYRAADAAFDRLRLARDQQGIRDAANAVQHILFYDPPAIFLAWDRTARAVSRRFSVPEDSDRDILYTIWQWQQIAPPARQEP